MTSPLSSFRAAVLAIAAGSTLAGAAVAHDYTLGGLAIGHPYARPTAPAQPTGGGYLSIANRSGGADRLVGAAAPSVAKAVELHSMRMEGNVMRMREVASVDIAPGQSVKLEPGGLHLMLVGLKAPLVVGAAFPLTLTFEKAGRIEVEVKVEPLAAGAAPMSSMAMPGASASAGAMQHTH
jgi:copper(I)-binding protein